MNLQEFTRELIKEGSAAGLLQGAGRLFRRGALKAQRFGRNLTGQSSRGAARKLRAVQGAQRQAAQGMTMPEQAPWHAAKLDALKPKETLLQQRVGKIKASQTRARTMAGLAGGGMAGGYLLGRSGKKKEE